LLYIFISHGIETPSKIKIFNREKHLFTIQKTQDVLVIPLKMGRYRFAGFPARTGSHSTAQQANLLRQKPQVTY